MQAYLDKYVGLGKGRLPQLAEASADWWLTEMPFFGGLDGLGACPRNK